MTLMSNLARAEMAVAYVDSVMKWPSQNKPDDVRHRQDYGLPYPDLTAMRDEYVEFVIDHDLSHGLRHSRDNVRRLLSHADFALKHGVGNCDELAAVAFKWLVEVRPVPSNVSVYAICGPNNNLFHTFLLLGEKEEPWMRQFFDESFLPATWPSDAVWCDPWRRDWFEIKDDWRRRVRMIARDCGQNFESPLGLFSIRCRAFSPAADRSQWRLTTPFAN